MTRTIIRSVLMLALAAMAASGVMAKERTPAGSFLNYRATTVQELSDQISSDAKASARLTKHFGVSEQRLLQFVEQNLELVSLKSALKVETWYVSSNGTTHKKTKLLPKGTLVFATREGKPVFQWSCGNPLSTSLPQPMVKTVTKVAGASEVASAGGKGDTTTLSEAQDVASSLPETKVLANPVETIATAAITVPPGFVEQIAPAVAGATPVAAIPIVEAVALPSVAAVPPIVGGGMSLGWLGGLAGLAGAAALAGGGGGGGGTLNPPLVPEPTTLLAMGYGLMSISMAVIRRRRQ